MSKTNKKEEPNQEKVMTRYDRKMEERRKQAEKDRRDNLISKIVAIAVAVVLIGSIVISVGISVNNKRKAISGVFMKVGEHKVTSLEYDYYYNIMLTNYMNTYSAFLPYMGLDTTQDLDAQAYDENRTWGDIFDEMAVEQIKETKALADDAEAAGFVHETADEEYKEYLEGFKSQAQTAGVALSEYYKSCFGDYATEARIEPFIRETLYVGAYTQKLLEDNKPTDEEITAKYEENKNNYDSVTYGLYTFSADVTDESTEEEITAAMEAAKAKAEEMKAARLAGEDFQALCDKYDAKNQEASEEEAEDEEDAEETSANKNIIENAGYNAIASSYADWMFDEARQANDIEIVEDESGHKYYVVEFMERVKPDTTDDRISSEIASERVNEYTESLTEKYVVEDVAGELVYLTKPAAAEEDSAESEEAAESETEESEEAVGNDAAEIDESAEDTTNSAE